MSYSNPITRPPETGRRYVWVVVCPVCKRMPTVWFGQTRCGCTPPGSHLDEMLERVQQGR